MKSVTLFIRALNDRRVSTRVIKLNGGIQFEEIDFNVDVYEKGAARIEAIIEPFNNEVSTENKRLARSIRVVNEKVNVLYLREMHASGIPLPPSDPQAATSHKCHFCSHKFWAGSRTQFDRAYRTLPQRARTHINTT